MIYADALRAYMEDVKQTPGEKVEHVVKCDINKPHPNKNRVERLNGTLRARVKDRGDVNPTIWPCQRSKNLLNFVKPHQALEGKTPA